MIQAFYMFKGSFQTLPDCNFVTLLENLLFFNDLNQEVRVMAVILGSDTLYRFFYCALLDLMYRTLTEKT